MGNTRSYNVQGAENDGNFWVYLRHELAHNMNVSHADGGGPEGETINGRQNNGYARMGTSELELVLYNRDSLRLKQTVADARLDANNELIP